MTQKQAPLKLSDATIGLTAVHIVENLPYAILIADSDGLIHDIAGQAESILCLSRKKLIGSYLLDLAHIGSLLMDAVKRAEKSGHTFQLFNEKLTNQITRHRVSTDIYVAPMENYPDRFLITLNSRPGTESAESAAPMAAPLLKNLSQVLAHEIKNPLAGIKGAAQLVARSLPADKQPLIDIITHEVDRISSLISRLRDRSGQGGTAAAFNIHEAILHACDLFETQIQSATSFKTDVAPLCIEKIFDPSLPLVLGHRDAFIQILLNLFQNSQEAVKEQEGTPAHITVQTRFQHGYMKRRYNKDPIILPVEILVSDQGPGMADSVKNRLFEPFTTTKEAGGGLGLALSALYMEEMGGQLRLKTDMETGTGFLINLKPASTRPRPKNQRQES